MVEMAQNPVILPVLKMHLPFLRQQRVVFASFAKPVAKNISNLVLPTKLRCCLDTKKTSTHKREEVFYQHLRLSKSKDLIFARFLSVFKVVPDGSRHRINFN